MKRWNQINIYEKKIAATFFSYLTKGHPKRGLTIWSDFKSNESSKFLHSFISTRFKCFEQNSKKIGTSNIRQRSFSNCQMPVTYNLCEHWTKQQHTSAILVFYWIAFNLFFFLLLFVLNTLYRIALFQRSSEFALSEWLWLDCLTTSLFVESLKHVGYIKIIPIKLSKNQPV